MSFPVLEEVSLGPVKIWVPRGPIFEFLIVLFVCKMGPSKNSWSNTVTFPFWEGLTVGPVKVPPPLREILATPCIGRYIQ